AAVAALVVVLAVGSTAASLVLKRSLEGAREAERTKDETLDEARTNLAKAEEAERGRLREEVDAHLALGPARPTVGALVQHSSALEEFRRPAGSARQVGLPPEQFRALRDAAIACLALPIDLRPTDRTWPAVLDGAYTAFDPAGDHFAFNDRGTVRVRRV